MRPVREITVEEENFRVESSIIKRNPVEPEPVGTIVLMAFRVTGYDQDFDGSLMARIEQLDNDGNTTGWELKNIGLYPTTDLVVTLEEFKAMFAAKPIQEPD